MKYHYNPDFNDINSQAYNIIKLIKPNSRCIDIGCASGQIALHLKNNKNCYVVGVDINHEYEAFLLDRLDDFIVCDVNKGEELKSIIKSGDYDYVILADIIEHLLDPGSFLKNLAEIINEEKVIISLPNICFWAQRIKLLFGKFEYQDTGILDRSHLHFFNLFSARKELSCYFDIDREAYACWYTPLEKILSKLMLGKRLAGLSSFKKIKGILVPIAPNFYSSQIIFLLRKKNTSCMKMQE